MAFLKSGISATYYALRILLCALFYRLSVKSQLAKEALCSYVSSWKWSKVCHCSVHCGGTQLIPGVFCLLLAITDLTTVKLTFHCALLPPVSANDLVSSVEVYIFCDQISLCILIPVLYLTGVNSLTFKERCIVFL